MSPILGRSDEVYLCLKMYLECNRGFKGWVLSICIVHVRPPSSAAPVNRINRRGLFSISDQPHLYETLQYRAGRADCRRGVLPETRH